LAGLQGEDCPSFEFVQQQVRDWELKHLDEWLQTAPPQDSPEYAAMREEHIAQVVADWLHPIALPPRHARQAVEHTNKDWVAAFQKVGKRLAEHEDAMIALLGARGTGKTQMAVELIRFLARHRVAQGVKPAHTLERWAWSYYRGSPPTKGFALYSNTMDFFLRLRKTFQPGADEKENDVLDDYIRPSLLILDEAHDRRGSDWENQMFTYLIDRRYQSASKQTVFIANQSKGEFEDNIGCSIADRLQECGGIVECNWQSFRRG
jgi:DNA replication protein DnaC